MRQLRLRRHNTIGDAEVDVAETIAATLGTWPHATLGFATGRSMIDVYRRLVTLNAPFQEAVTFNLDEYCGLAADHPASFRTYMRAHLFACVNLGPKAAHFPLPGAETDFERTIAERGGVDLQLLGLGRNGHIGFNEPGSSGNSRTRQVARSRSTLTANATNFPDEKVSLERAVTMGVGTILEARRLLMLVTGAAKAEALRAMLESPVTPDVPASFLQEYPAVDVVCDAEATALLNETAGAFDV